MAISPIGGAAAFKPPAATGVTPAAGKEGFGNAIGDALESLEHTQTNADDLATKAATGDLTDVHDYMIAATQASLATELTVAVRNKAVEAFSDIMRMQI
jgi:flagellar hook-basal body complex protein FliE